MINKTKKTITSATTKLKYISFYHALSLLYGYKEEYFDNFLKNQNQSIKHIRSAVVLHDLSKASKQSHQPTYEYDFDKLIDEENLKEQNKTYNKFDSLYSQFPQAAEKPDKKRIVTKEFLKWATKFGYIHNPFTKHIFDENAKNILFEALSNHKLISNDSRVMPWQWLGNRNQLSYLAKYLKSKRQLGDDCHKALSVYISDTNPTTKKPLKNITGISDKSKEKIKSVADEFIAETSK